MSCVKVICKSFTMLALSVSCFAQSPRVIAQELCDQLDQAMANQNLNQVLGFYDASYVGTDTQGKRAGFAELRRQLENGISRPSVFRRLNPTAIVEDVESSAGRMVVHYKDESHFEYYDSPDWGGWVPMIARSTGIATWEKKGNQWKIVRATIFREDYQVDPKWAAVPTAIINNHYEVAKRVAESMGSSNRH